MTKTAPVDQVQSSEPCDLSKQVIGSMTCTAGLRISGLALAFGTNVLLARYLGVREYGVLAYLLAWAGLLSVVGVFGLDRLLVMKVAEYHLRHAWGLLRGLLFWGQVTAISITLMVCALGYVICRSCFCRSELPILTGIAPVGVLLVAMVIMRILGSGLQGLHRVTVSQISEALIQPSVYILLIVAAAVICRGKLLAGQVLLFCAVATAGACIFSAWKLRNALPPESWSATKEYDSRRWLISALPIFLVAILDALNGQISSLVLGALSGAAALGTYAAADRGAQLVVLPLTVANLVLAPTFSRLFHAGEHAELQRVTTRSARAVLASSALIALTLLIGGRWFLLMFGHGFVGGRIPLDILCLGQLINASMGSVAFLLIMTGHGREAAIGIGAGVAVSFSLNMLLIPVWSAAGAAAASAISLIVWNAVLAILVWKRLRIVTTAFGRISAG